MRTLTLFRSASSIGAAAALLTACSGSQPPLGPYGMNGTAPAASHDQVFHYTGSEQSFKVPSGVTHLRITAHGADGAAGLLYPSGYPAPGGGGGIVTATIPVTGGERLAIFVGGSGQHGGFNGGAGVAGGSKCSSGCASFGGGASDVRQGGDKLADRVIVAAGGGGGAQDGCFCPPSCRSQGDGCTTDAGAGGGGGGRIGGSGKAGSSYESSGRLGGGGGSGGTQETGGQGGAGGGGGSSCTGSTGALGAGGVGGYEPDSCGGPGGGGGGGYYGGGGGGGGGYGSGEDYGAGGGGGGGSSFVEKGARHVKMTPGLREAASKSDGSIVILW
jgi:hypothetical protein